MAIRTGIILAAAWAMILLVAFLSYPKPDNLVTGYVVYALFGQDALGRLTITGAIGVGVMQIAACFLLGYLVGRIIQDNSQSR